MRAHRVRPSPLRRTCARIRPLRRCPLTLSMSWEDELSRPSHRHCRHRCERPLRMDLPSTGWVTALAGFLARGSLPSCVRPSQFPSGRMDAGSPLTVAGAATDRREFKNFEPAVSVFPLSSSERPEEPARLKFSLERRDESSDFPRRGTAIVVCQQERGTDAL